MLAPKLDEGDLKTIRDPKYRALKQEVTGHKHSEPMLTLTKSGVYYLKDTWRINVNKNGQRSFNKVLAVPIPATVKKASQRLDNYLFNAIKLFYKKPNM